MLKSCAFCQSFMTELCKHRSVHRRTGRRYRCGGREIGFLFGQYKRLRNEYTGVLTGKGLSYGGSLGSYRGYRLRSVLLHEGNARIQGHPSFEGKTVAISGSGNVAIYACQKATAGR